MNYQEQRKHFYITQQDLADDLGITKTAVCKFEQGKLKSKKIEDAYTDLNLSKLMFNKYLGGLKRDEDLD